jgi:hypothetical protein
VTSPPPGRSNKLALVAVAVFSLIIGGLAMRFAGTRPGPEAITPSAIAAPAQTSIAAGAPSPVAQPADDNDGGVVMELPASVASSTSASRARGPGRTAPAGKKQPGARASGSGRPFMPNDL